MAYKGWLVPSLLLCIRDRDSSRGHELAARLVELDFRNADMERLYKVLRKMERESWVTSDDSSVDGSADWFAERRYEITAAGEKHLELWAAAFEKYYIEIARFLRLYDIEPVRWQESLT
jgi:DNA-binding PadR family transcriptional regulator